LEFLIDIFGVTNSSRILIEPDPTQPVDIEVRLGKDWVSKLPPDLEETRPESLVE